MSADNIDSSESAESLVEPTLNSIYDSKSLLDENDKDNDVYNHLQEDIANSSSSRIARIAKLQTKNRPLLKKLRDKNYLTSLFGKTFILGLSGIVFVILSENIHDNNILLTSHVVYRPFIVSSKIVNALAFDQLSEQPVPSVYVGFFWGVLLGVIQPLLDLIFPKSFTQKLFHFTKGSSTSPLGDFPSIVRSIIVLLGISFGLRKIDWENTLQASIAFSLLNPCVWLLLDSTISGFIGCLVFAIISTALVVVFDDNSIASVASITSNENLALNLFTASFFFCSLLIYGKLGRFLFLD